MKCPNCKKEISDELKICDKCGSHIEYLVGLYTMQDFLHFEQKQDLEYLKKNDIFMEPSDDAITIEIVNDEVELPFPCLYEELEPDKKKDSKARGAFLPVFIIVAAIAFILCGLFVAFTVFQSKSKPVSSTYYEPFTEDMIGPGEPDYVKGRLLITAREDIAYHKIKKLVEEENGEIVGYIAMTNDYQIQYPEGTTYTDLQNYQDILIGSDKITNVTFEEVFDLNYDSINYNTDPWDGSIKWNPVFPDDNNWWAEALSMQNIWEANDSFREVRVGIVDGYFDANHGDLKEAYAKDGIMHQEVIGLSNSYDNDIAYSHGTHVAGIIGARNNDFGICGVSQNATIYGYSIGNRLSSGKTSIMAYKCAIASLLENDVKIINISLGSRDLYERIHSTTDSVIPAVQSLEEFLCRCLRQKDFLLIKSAGNNGSSQEDGDAAYDFLATITKEEIREHMIIVGAYDIDQSNGQNIVKIQEYSNRGFSTDLYAPGGSLISADMGDVGVISDIPGDELASYNGTSQAAPMVSGIAALVWGSNLALRAEDVKDIILASSVITPIGNDNYIRLANAYAAVLMTNKEDDSSLFMGYTYLKDKGMERKMTTSTFEVYDFDSGEMLMSDNTNHCGSFHFYLKPGKYKIKASYDKGRSIRKIITVEPDHFYYCPMWSDIPNEYIKIKFNIDEENPQKKILRAYDIYNNILWEKEYELNNNEDVDFITDIMKTDDKFIYYKKGKIKAVNIKNGKKIWSTSQILNDAYACSTTDGKYLYIMGKANQSKTRHDLLILNMKDGRVLKSYPRLHELDGHSNPSSVEKNGNHLIVTYQSDYDSTKSSIEIKLKNK